MKKYFVFIPIILSLVVSAAVAQEREPSRFGIRLGATPAYAIDRLGNLADRGVGGTVGFEVRPLAGLPEMSLRADGHYIRLLSRAANESDVTVMSGMVDLKLTPSWQTDTRLYLFAGGGYSTVELQDAGSGQFLVDSLTTESKPSVEIGVGMERKGASGPGFFVEIAGVNILSDQFGDYRFGRLTFGILF